MKKAAPQNKQSSPTRLQITAKHYAAAILDALDVVIYGVLILALTSLVMAYLT